MSKTLTQFRAQIGYPQNDNNQSEKFNLTGGMDIDETPALGDPGRLIFSSNYEPSFAGGYISKGGAEPVDGSRQPSAFVYYAVPVTITTPSKVPQAGGQLVTWTDPDTALGASAFFLGWEIVGGLRCIILSLVSQTLVTSDYSVAVSPFDSVLSIGVVISTATGTFATVSGDPTYLTDVGKIAQYITLSRFYAIQNVVPVQVPITNLCTGPSLGVVDFGSLLFAFRESSALNQTYLFYIDFAGNTKWQSPDLGSIVYYTNNTVQINPGDIIVGATSGATRKVVKVITMFGTIGGTDALGYMSVNTGTGNFIAGENIRAGATVVAKTPATGNIEVLNKLPAGGSYRFRRWNFTGNANDTRLYGVNGVGTAFEIQFSLGLLTNVLNFTPIITGQGLSVATFNSTPTLDKPTHIAAWQDQLFLAYRGGNLLHSGYQDPTNWTAVEGADQRVLGEDVTNLVEDVNSAMFITTRNRIYMLYGDVNENFQLRDLATTFGAYPFTAERMNGVTFLTDEGVMTYNTSGTFSNFEGDSLSVKVNSLLKAYMRSGDGPIEASISRDRNLYRLFFDGGVCFSFCIVGGQLTGIGICSYGMPVHNIWSAASTIRNTSAFSQIANSSVNPPGDKIYFCSDDGFVYQDDTGGTFGSDSRPIETSLQTQFYYGQQYINNEKYYRRMYIDVVGVDVYTNLSLGAEYDDGAGYRTPEVLENVSQYMTGGAYNQSSLYAASFYGAVGRNVIRKELHGQGVGFSLVAQSSSSIAPPHTIQAAQIAYELRKRRGWR